MSEKSYPKAIPPDTYVCQDCKARFQKAETVEITEDDIIITRKRCPKCGGENLVISWWIDGPKKQ
ncbi:MAG: hypothetical protein ACE5R6_12265 [Candidatus Heimdallarchaeota archaeon]